MVESRRNGLQLGFIGVGMCLLLCLASSESFVGINFGSHIFSPFDPKHYVGLVKNLGVGHVRLHDTNSLLLDAFAYTDVEILIGITNDLIPRIASSQAVARSWVKDNVLDHYPRVKITGVVVGNEVLTELSSAGVTLLPAMKNIHNALVEAKLERMVKVSTSHSSSLLSAMSFPSQAHFKDSFSTLIKPLLDFLSETESYFMLSVNPMVLYLQSKHNTSLDYALFIPNQAVSDENASPVYQNLFDAVVDATFMAMAAMDHPALPIVVSETGWPWTGAQAEEASLENAAIFNQNLVRHVLSNNGTPLRPDAEIHTYMFDPFTEAKKAGITPRHQWSMSGSFPQKPLDYRHLLGFSARDTANGSTNPSQSWCVAKGGVPDSQLATALNWACGPQGNADCGPIQTNGPCFNPDTYSSHASYAFNSYYQKSGQTAQSCDFGGAAMVVQSDPSYQGCSYPPSGGSASGPGSGSGSGNQTFNPNGSNDNPNFGEAVHVSSLFIAAFLPLHCLAYLRL